jgi:hypothetical protein
VRLVVPERQIHVEGVVLHEAPQLFVREIETRALCRENLELLPSRLVSKMDSQTGLVGQTGALLVSDAKAEVDERDPRIGEVEARRLLNGSVGGAESRRAQIRHGHLPS